MVVDDFLLASSNPSLAKSFRLSMEAVFDFKSLGRPEYMIGLHLSHGNGRLDISQRQYIQDMESRYSDALGPFLPTHTPAPGGLRLNSKGVAGSSPTEPADRKLYRSLVGSLMYAVVSRPDIATIVSMCARFLERNAHHRTPEHCSSRLVLLADHSRHVAHIHSLELA